MITHYTKNGSILPDIEGHVVRAEEAKKAYDIMLSMKKERKKCF